MALTRKLLKSLGLSEEVQEAIIDAHTETVAALKDEINTHKAQVEGIPALTKERDELKKEVETLKANDGDAAKVQADFDAYKQQVEGEKALAAKRKAMDAFLKDKVGIQRDDARELILAATKFDDIKLDDAGALTDQDALAKSYGEKYASFVGKAGTRGTPPTTPPSNGGNGMTKEEIMKITDRQERLTAIAQNQHLFTNQ